MRQYVALLLSAVALVIALNNRDNNHLRSDIQLCLNNPAYVGASVEDNRALFSQCLDDVRK